MGRVEFEAELGYAISALDGDKLVSQLAGAAAPGGDAGLQDAAGVGSTYQRTDGTLYVKIASANAPADWQNVLSSGVLSGGYAPVNGDPTAGDTFEQAIAKLDGNTRDIQSALGIPQGDVDFGTFTGTLLSDNQTAKQLFQILETAVQEIDVNVNDLVTLTGVPENSTDLGTFTGSVISDNNTIKGALQELETFAESISGGTAITVSGITTLQDIDTVLVDDVHAVEWEVVVWEEATPTNKQFFKITALHDGTASADAVNVDDTKHTRLRHGGNFNNVFVVDLNGTGVTQTMRLRASSSTAGIALEARRTSVV